MSQKTKHNIEENDSDIGIIVVKNYDNKEKCAPDSDNTENIQFVNIERHREFITAVFSSKHKEKQTV